MSDDPSKARFRELQKLARSGYDGNTQAVLTVYAVEGFLRRLSASEYATRMVLKGGMLMAAMSARRMTRDADLATHGMTNDASSVTRAVAAIAIGQPRQPDHLIFDVESIVTQTMRADADYHGVRAKLVAHLSTASSTVALDFSFGDPSTTTVVDLPALLGGPPIRLASYPLELSLSEKIASMMSRRELNTRDRDFADVWVLSRIHRIEASELRAQLDRVATHRSQTLAPLRESLANMPDRQQPYKAMLRRMSYEREPPSDWTHVLDDVRAFVDPLIEDAHGRLAFWDPATTSWRT